MCPDEINSLDGGLVAAFENYWGGHCFPLGGISGAPLSGKTGFAAFSHHVPTDWNVLVVFAPHVAIIENGVVGSCARDGQAKVSHACGAVIGAYHQCMADLNKSTSANSLTTARYIANGEFDKDDMQMDWVRKQLYSHADRISKTDCPRALPVQSTFGDREAARSEQVGMSGQLGG